MATSVNDLDKAVEAELDRFALLTVDAIQEAQKTAAKNAVKTLKKTSPGRGGYAKGWKQTTQKTRTGSTTTIYQGEKPWLPHLLEFGHPIIAGGRTAGQAKAFEHIAPVERQALSEYEADIARRFESGT